MSTLQWRVQSARRATGQTRQVCRRSEIGGWDGLPTVRDRRMGLYQQSETSGWVWKQSETGGSLAGVAASTKSLKSDTAETGKVRIRRLVALFLLVAVVVNIVLFVVFLIVVCVRGGFSVFWFLTVGFRT